MTTTSYVDDILAQAATAEAKNRRIAYNIRTFAMTAALDFVIENFPEIRELEDQLRLADSIAEDAVKMAYISLQHEPTDFISINTTSAR